MAMAPTPAAAPMPPADAMPPANMDAAPDAAEPEVIATVCKNPDGTYMLYAGDEPGEGDMEGEEPTEGETFPTPQALMKGLMLLLNDGGAAEDSFGKGFRGEEDDSAGGPMKAPPAAM